MSDSGKFSGKIALVTGGASGIGKATVEELVARGAQVFIADRNIDGANQLATELGGTTKAISLDVTDEAQWQSIIADIVESAGGLDLLVNSAGITQLGKPQSPEDFDIADWRQIFAINVEGTALGCKTALPAMHKSGGGAIINLASIVSVVSSPENAPYGATKGAIEQYTWSLAAYCGMKNYNIRCNMVMPGIIDTPLMAGAPAERRKALEDVTPMHRFGTAQEVAQSIVYLLSDEASFITGASLSVDGGMRARPMI